MGPIIDIDETFRDRIATHLNELSPASRRMRFFSNLSSTGVDSYIQRIDWKKDTCFGVMDNHKIVAFVHLAFIDTDQMELGISVSDDYQKCGLGNALMKRVVTWCKAHNITNLVMECLSENSTMQKMAKKQGMRLVNDYETAIAQAAIKVSFPERITEIQKNMIYENIALIDKSMRMFYDQCLSWNHK